MPVKIACPKCSKNYTLPDSALGKAVKCKECGTAFRTRMPSAAAQPAAPAKPAARPTQPGARPASPGARPTSPGARPTSPGVRPASQTARPTNPSARPTRPAPAKPAQPVSPDLGQFGVEGGFQPQADIFGAPPSRGGAGLGNFAEEGLGEAVTPIVLGPEGGAQPVQANPYQSVMTNTALKRGGGKPGGLRRKKGSSGASFDPDSYSVARIGMMIVMVSGAIFLMASVFFTAVTFLGSFFPEATLNLLFVISIVTMILSILCFVAFLCGAVGQLICVFAPEGNEKMNAGAALGLMFLTSIGSFVLVQVMKMPVGNTYHSQTSMVAVGFLIAGFVLAVMALVSVILFANYYRVIGKNIKSKELVSAGKQGFAAVGLGVAGQVVLFLILLGIRYAAIDPGAMIHVARAMLFGYALLWFVVYGLLIRMVMVGVNVLKG